MVDNRNVKAFNNSKEEYEKLKERQESSRLNGIKRLVEKGGSKMKKQELIKIFSEAIICNKLRICVSVKIKGNEDPELIINFRSNFASKLVYYEKAYNDDLELISNPDIKIEGCVAFDEFSDLEEELKFR